MPKQDRLRRRRLAVAVLPIILALSAGAKADAAKPDIVERVLHSQTQLARELIEQLARGKPGENIVVSPASLAGMLTAADLGAGPITHDAILKVLQIAPGATAPQEFEALRTATIRAGDSDLTLATRLMFDRSEPPTAEAMKRLQKAGVESGVEDLHGPAALADIDAWAARVTAGKITHVLDRIDPADRMIALSALLFKASWSINFRQAETGPADFHLASGQRIRAPFMHLHKPQRLPVREDDRFIGVQLPFAAGLYQMVIITTKDKALPIEAFGDHLTWLSGEGFNNQDLTFVEMPPFRLNSRMDLTSSFEALGYDHNDLFTTFTKQPLVLSEVRQIVDIEVDEQGAEVAAVTSGEFEIQLQGGVRWTVKDIIVDKPFAYALRDSTTGTIVVAGFITSIDGKTLSADASPISARSPQVATAAEIEATAAQQAKNKGAAKAAKLPIGEVGVDTRLRMEKDF